MTILFYLIFAICLLHALVQITIGLTEIVIGVTQIVCGSMMMAFNSLRRLILGKRKPAVYPEPLWPQSRTRRPVRAQGSVPHFARRR